ncbi:unnamed protein product [Prorocentrum cordatum]|uniref:Uncharacterized protein n=1 Tax=Prorocentrum cordatum TaxID=2364126 RepID=A0ABN9XUJ5_9DINO|nr:unnamed protein product [Polarella glacialis]
MPPAPQSPRAGVRRREEEEGAATRSLLGRDAPGLCSSLDPEAQRVQVVDCEADALSASIRSTRAPDLLESKDQYYCSPQWERALRGMDDYRGFSLCSGSRGSPRAPGPSENNSG